MADKENRNVINLIVGFAFLLLFLAAINPLSRPPLYLYIAFLAVSLLVYSSRQYQKVLIGLKGGSNFFRSLFLAIFIGGVFYASTRLIPGLSLGLPILPNAISDQLKLFIIVICAPIAEEVLFRGSLLGYVRNFNPSKKALVIAIFVQAIAFSLFHLLAYITNFYQLPSILAGATAISANISAFTAAGVFGLLSGFFVTRDGVKNLWFSIFLHMIINFIIYTKLVVSF